MNYDILSKVICIARIVIIVRQLLLFPNTSTSLNNTHNPSLLKSTEHDYNYSIQTVRIHPF